MLPFAPSANASVPIICTGSSVRRVREIRTQYKLIGPVRSSVTYIGRTPDEAIRASMTAELYRADDYPRLLFRLKYDILQNISSWNRLVLFQLGADNYNENKPSLLTCGHHLRDSSASLTQALPSSQTKGYFLTGITNMTWCALTGEERVGTGAWANRAIIVRRYASVISGRHSGSGDLPDFASYYTATGTVIGPFLKRGFSIHINSAPVEFLQAFLSL